jgi:hypothetical protein
MKRFEAAGHTSQGDSPVTDAELRAYLLGQSSESAAARLEERVLEDDEALADLEGIEDDLFDDFAQNRLDPMDRERFLARYGHDARRLHFARALANRTGRSKTDNVVPFPMMRRHWMPLAAAATLTLAVGGLMVSQNVQSKRTERDPFAVPSPAAVPAAASVILTLGNSRAGAAPFLVALPKDAVALQLRVRLNPNDKFDRYALELRSAADNIVWGAMNVRATTGAGEMALTADVPASALAAGSYELAVQGINTAAPSEPLGFVTLQVSRTP